MDEEVIDDDDNLASIRGKNCLTLAHRDTKIKNELVKYDQRIPESLVREIKPESYEKLKKENKSARRFEHILTKCYQDIKESDFEIKFDGFGGYGLFYVGMQKLLCGKTKKYIIPELCALVHRVPKALEVFYQTCFGVCFDKFMLPNENYARPCSFRQSFVRPQLPVHYRRTEELQVC